MFDYIDIQIIGIRPEEVLSIPELDFYSPVNLNTGELNSYNINRKRNSPIQPKIVKRTKLGSLLLKVTNDKHINLEGSLHEYFHGNNYSKFTYWEVVEALRRIENSIHCSSESFILHNLEFGLNIPLPFPVSLFLESLLFYKGQEPDRQSYEGRGNLRKFTFQQYEVKFYDKGKQYGLNSPLLRVEIKVVKMNYLHEKGIYIRTLKDLLKSEYYHKLKELLLMAISGLMLYDNGIEEGNLSLSERRLYKACNSPRYWPQLWEGNQSLYRKRAPIYRELIDREGKNKFRETISGLISQNWDEISSTTGTEITNGENLNQYGNNTYTKQLEPYQSETVLRMETPSRFCKSCGGDISEQHPRSIFCSESKYGKEGKKCRNKDSNPRNNFLKREKRIQERGLLFDISPFLVNCEFRREAC